MEALIIKPTDRSLSVSLTPETGKFIFSGRSLPEDGKAFFAPILDWLKKYSLKPSPLTQCVFRMEYFNSSSRKCFVDVFNILEGINENGHSITIIWQYEAGDDELKEIGEEYKDLYDLDFELQAH